MHFNSREIREVRVMRDKLHGKFYRETAPQSVSGNGMKLLTNFNTCSNGANDSYNRLFRD